DLALRQGAWNRLDRRCQHAVQIGAGEPDARLADVDAEPHPRPHYGRAAAATAPRTASSARGIALTSGPPPCARSSFPPPPPPRIPARSRARTPALMPRSRAAGLLATMATALPPASAASATTAASLPRRSRTALTRVRTSSADASVPRF